MRKHCVIIEAEDGPEYQEYVYGNGERVPAGEPVGVEVFNANGDGSIEFIILEDIYFASEAQQY